VRVGLHNSLRSCAGIAKAVQVEIDADPAGRKESSIATPEIEHSAVGERRDPPRRPLDRIGLR
jgi:hypothetical protein